MVSALLAVDCCMAVTQQCSIDIVDVEAWSVQRSQRLWCDSLVVRALVRKTRGPGFDPQLRCLNMSFLRPSVSAVFLRLVCWNGLIDVFTQSGSALSCIIICKSVHRITSHGVGRCWPLLAVDCGMAVTQQCSIDIGDVETWSVQRS